MLNENHHDQLRDLLIDGANLHNILLSLSELAIDQKIVLFENCQTEQQAKAINFNKFENVAEELKVLAGQIMHVEIEALNCQN